MEGANSWVMGNIELCQKLKYLYVDLYYPVQIRWVIFKLISRIEHCFSPPNWLMWTKLEVIEYIWSLSLMTFSISFPSILKKWWNKNFLECYILVCLVWDNNWCQSLEIQGPKAKTDICISNIDKVCDIFIVSYQNFKITL